MSRIITFLLICFKLVSSPCLGEELISRNEAEFLSQCFKSILENSEAGYVLYGQKPLCTIEYLQDSFYFEPRELHQRSVALCMAKEILKRPFFHTGEILFHFDESNEMLLVINKSKFLSVVEENRALFQYVLGPTITPELLLEVILSPSTSFFETLKYDRVLIGIVLGYGVQNSLYQSRYENIFCDLIYIEDLPPFLPSGCFCINKDQKEDLFFLEKDFFSSWSKDRRWLSPSYGYASLQAEFADIEDKTQISSHKLQESPNFIFSCLKDSQENKILLSELESVQEKIRCLLISENLLQGTLALISKHSIAVEEERREQKPFNVDLHLAFAKLLRGGTKKYQSKYLSCFLEGFNGNVSDSELDKEILSYPNALEHIQKAKNNLKAADRYFQKIKKNRSFSAILNPYLYYSLVEPGSGPPLEGQTDVVIDYEIFSPSGKKLSSAISQHLDLRKALPAFSHGIQGMKIGEKRELLIHPSLAYGVHTSLEKGIYLKAIVTLRDSCGLPDKTLPPLEPVDLSFILDKNFYRQSQEQYKRALKLIGSQKRKFLKTCPEINLDLIEAKFQSPEATTALTDKESAAINFFFWKLYFQHS